MRVRNSRNALLAAVASAALGAASPAWADTISTAFNFVPFGTLTANTGDVTTATTITPGAPDGVTTILVDNTGLVSGTSIILTDPTPTTLGATFTKTFTTALGTFTESLTVTNVTTGIGSRSILATGTIVETLVISGTLLDPAPVFYSASYTQNQGPGSLINASFNDSTIVATPIPAALPLFATGLGALGLLGWRRKRKAPAAV
jgi:hypothetical protein